MEDLTNKCFPLVKMMLRFVVIGIGTLKKEFHEIYDQKHKDNYNLLVENTKNAITGMKEVLGEQNPFDEFSKLIAPTG